ncbi:ferrous iron transport protein A [Catenibacillus scindens]|uniref:Ferrous iron transport protein A n=1 Tax=Catenibacillus scindens TaxID=673271 RepID=A0A7W8H9A6_9FIRM|nr:FeoA domain-containing protein [Catenibacillus scindens]MBB5263853.1 ferrous iron transport protein A [Catenibacillus scindens]
MTLAEGKIGNTYQVLKTEVEENTERRLEALGLTEGTKVLVLNRKGSGTMIFNVRGTRLAVGPQIAQGISVKEAAAHE